MTDRFLRTLFTLGFGLLFIACGDDADAKPAPDCGGDADEVVMLSARVGGGMVAPGSEILSRSGMYMLLTGSCELHCGSARGEVFETKLTPAEAEELWLDLEFDRIKERAGSYPGGVADAPSELFRAGEDEIVSDGGVADASPDWLRELHERASHHFASCPDRAEPVKTPVRYVLMEFAEGEEPNDASLTWAEWPLDVSASSVATSEWGEGFELDEAMQIASGEDAEALRALRGRLLRGELGPASMPQIPIAEGERRYYLYLADTSRLEDEDGLMPFAKKSD